MAYTFKDDGQQLTYYREYNKEVGTGDKTLIGNWVEERALRDNIDSGRYKLWTNPSPDPHADQTMFTKSTSRPDGHDTFRRTVAHNNHTPPAEYVTSNNVPDPGYCVYANPEKGAREKLMEERAMALAQQMVPATEALPSQLVSTYQQDYHQKDLPPVETMGKRVMIGEPDLAWRKELGITAPHMAPDETPLQDGYTHVSTFGASHGRDNKFTLPIEYTKEGVEKNC